MASHPQCNGWTVQGTRSDAEQGKPSLAHHRGVKLLHREGIQTKTSSVMAGLVQRLTSFFCCGHEQWERWEEPAKQEETLGCLDDDAWE